MFDSINMATVQENISFAGKNAVFKDDNSIPVLQCKGVTALCKILSQRQYAYLADEVGMGKTYQAIGVIAMLLTEKKNAKILIVAPNEAVQRNWINELNNFNNNNLINGNKIEAVALHPVELIGNYAKEKKAATVSVVRLTSFSSIGEHIVGKGKPSNKYSEVRTVSEICAGLKAVTGEDFNIVGRRFDSHDAGKLCGCALKKYTPKFDLVVIDEAQNIRNQNNATAFFNYWMGLKRFELNVNTDIGVALQSIPNYSSYFNNRKYLLMSATPAHRGIDSLRRQLLYFEKAKNIPEIDHEYLAKFMIRRLRTYSGDSKYAVRNITAYDVAKNLDLDQRLFLALIQSKLAQMQAANNTTFKIGFLETFESYDTSNVSESKDDETGEKNKEFENGGSSNPYERGSALDKKMLESVAKSFKRMFKEEKCPPHPKLNFMEKEAENLININLSSTNFDTPDKAIVFVRRLASVSELVNSRLNRLYENKIFEYWGRKLGIARDNPNLNDIQNAFQNIYKGLEVEELDENDIDVSANNDGEETKSLLLQWLAVKKSDKGNAYSCVSLFKKSMMRNKPNSYFFDENYFRTVHSELEESDYVKLVNDFVDDELLSEVSSYISSDYSRYLQGKDKKLKLNYSYLMALVNYLALEKEHHPLADKLKKFFDFKEKGVARDNIKKDQIIDILLRTSLWNCVESSAVKSVLYNHILDNFNKREALKSWTEKYLKSSEAILEFLYLFCTHNNRKLEDRAKLCKLVWEILYSDECAHGKRIDKLFENADLVVNQLLGNEIVTYKYDPAFLNLQQWVMPAVGGNKGNEALIKRFNTPFYPDLIVCTDVLKEGINLHLFCNRVYHYGLAWTPGDLEQRIGRVDRFFSKTHRERMLGKGTQVQVGYPYMGKSVDEHQLRKVLKFKLSADPLLDTVEEKRKDISIDLDDTSSLEELVKYVPDSNSQTNFPYSGEKFWKD